MTELFGDLSFSTGRTPRAGWPKDMRGSFEMMILTGDLSAAAAVTPEGEPAAVAQPAAAAAVAADDLPEDARLYLRHVEGGETIRALNARCRTVAINERPLCLSSCLGKLREAGAGVFRADFIHRRYEPADVVRIWRQVRAGENVARTASFNFLTRSL